MTSKSLVAMRALLRIKQRHRLSLPEYESLVCGYFRGRGVPRVGGKNRRAS